MKLGDSPIAKINGRLAPDAYRVQTADDHFGKDVTNREVNVTRAPAGMFITPTMDGQQISKAAIAQAEAAENYGEVISGLGSVLNDIGVRQINLKKAQDDSQQRAMQQEMELSNAQRQQKAASLRLENGWTPKQMEDWYEEQTANDIASLQKKYSEFDFLDDKKRDDFLNGMADVGRFKFQSQVLESAIVDQIKDGHSTEFSSMTQKAAIAGSRLDIKPLLEVIEQMQQKRTDPKFRMLYKDADQMVEKQVLNSVVEWAENAAHENPKMVSDLINSEDSPINKMLPEEVRADLSLKVERIMKRAVRDTEIEHNRFMTSYKRDLKNGIIENKVGELEIKNDPNLDALEREELMNFISKRDGNLRSLAAASAKWKTAFVTGDLFGQKLTAADKNSLEQYHSQFSEETLSALPLEDRWGATIDHYGKIGHLPESVTSSLTKSLEAAESSEEAIQVVGKMQELKRVSPYLYQKNFGKSDLVVRLVDAGMPIKEARKSLVRSRQTDPKIWKNQTTQYFKDNGQVFNDFIEDRYGFSGDINPSAEADYKLLFQNNLMLLDGNIEAATSRTNDEFVTTWGINNIDTTQRMTKYSPSVVYGDPFNNDANEWIKEQLIEEVKEETGLDLNNEQYIVEIEPMTIRSKNPSYTVMVIDKKTGFVSPVIGGWYPDKKAMLRKKSEQVIRDNDPHPHWTAAQQQRNK